MVGGPSPKMLLPPLFVFYIAKPSPRVKFALNLKCIVFFRDRLIARPPAAVEQSRSGFALILRPTNYLREVDLQLYDYSLDIWSLGCMLAGMVRQNGGAICRTTCFDREEPTCHFFVDGP